MAMKTWRITLALLVLTLLPSAAGATGYKIETIALSGQAAPVTTGEHGWIFQEFRFPRIDAAGNVAFRASIAKPAEPETTRGGAWLTEDTLPQPLVVTGDVIAADGTMVNGIVAALLGAGGQVLVTVRTDAEPSGSPLAFIAGPPGATKLLAAQGLPMPGDASGDVVSALLHRAPGLNASGAYALNILTGLAGGGSAYDVWLGQFGVDGDLPHRIGRDAAEDNEPLEPQCCFSAVFGLSALDHIPVYRHDRDPVDGSLRMGYWRLSFDGALQFLIFAGDPAPGLPGESFVEFFDYLSTNGAGDLVFSADLGISADEGPHDNSLWFLGREAAAPVLLARDGDPAPGTGGETFQGLPSHHSSDVAPAVVNVDGTVAFCAARGIWYGKPGALSRVASEGDPAPGTQQAFSDDFLDSDDPATCGVYLNGGGELAFAARLADSDPAVHGIWAGKPGTPGLVARTGRTLRVAPNDGRLVAGLEFVFALLPPSGGEDGRATMLNDAGQVVFVANFTDGSGGVFRATPIMPAEAAPLIPIINYLLNDN